MHDNLHFETACAVFVGTVRNFPTGASTACCTCVKGEVVGAKWRVVAVAVGSQLAVAGAEQVTVSRWAGARAGAAGAVDQSVGSQQLQLYFYFQFLLQLQCVGSRLQLCSCSGSWRWQGLFVRQKLSVCRQQSAITRKQLVAVRRHLLPANSFQFIVASCFLIVPSLQLALAQNRGFLVVAVSSTYLQVLTVISFIYPYIYMHVCGLTEWPSHTTSICYCCCCSHSWWIASLWCNSCHRVLQLVVFATCSCKWKPTSWLCLFETCCLILKLMVYAKEADLAIFSQDVHV